MCSIPGVHAVRMGPGIVDGEQEPFLHLQQPVLSLQVGPKGGHSRLSVAAPGTGWQLHEDTELLQNTKSVAGNRQAGIPAAGNAAAGAACAAGGGSF